MVVANWKMNLNLAEALVVSGMVAKCSEPLRNIDIVLAPASVFIYPIYEHVRIRSKNLKLALQDFYFEPEGAFTGEISAGMIKGVCSSVIIGHSERRKYFGETDEAVNKKTKFALKNNLAPIVCVGESERFHLEDHYQTELKRMKSSGGIISQIDKALAGLSKADIAKVVLAYEPVWAIGTGNAATGVYAAAVAYIVKTYIEEKYGVPADEIRVLYGGSVDQKNVKEYMLQPSLDGLLVGSSSLNAKGFCEICRITSEVKSGQLL